MSFTVKAYLMDGERLREIRRFAIDQGASTNYDYLVQKISRMFSSLQGKKFRTYWRDAEGDNVAFSSDDELMEALSYKDDTFKVYLEVDATAAAPSSSGGAAPTTTTTTDGSRGPKEPPATAAGPVHPHVMCDVCNGPVKGMRFKCTVCPDYDLCSACERAGEHPEHDMLRIAKPRSSSSCPYMAPPPRPAHPNPHPPLYCGATPSGVPKEWGLWCNGGSGSAGCCGCSAGSGGSGAVGAEAAAAELARHARQLLEPMGVDVHLEVKDRPCGAATTEPMAAEGCGGADGVDGKRQQEPPAASQKPGSTYPFWPTEVPAVLLSQHAPVPMDQQQQQQRGADEQEEDIRVAAAVENMRVMGFHNDDGWLTALLRSNGCDLPKAVDEVLRRSAYRQQ